VREDGAGCAMNAMLPPQSAARARNWWLLYALAAVSFLPALAFYYVGEEAIFTISSLEMWYHGEWLRQLLYGGNVMHNPLFNWLIIPLASALGWEHVLPVARVLTISATLATGGVVAWLAHALYRDATLAALAALVYVTFADVLFYRGWLAYVDPLFAFFIALSIAGLWVGCERRRARFIALAVAAVTAAFMSKAFTAYVFYGTAGFALLFTPRYRALLLAPASWGLHAIGAALAAAWLALVPANTGQATRMLAEILAKLAPDSPGAYLVKLVTYPLETVALLVPALLVAGWHLWRSRRTFDPGGDPHLHRAAWICLLGYLPYWLAPQSGARYLLPLYPVAAFALARVLWLLGEVALRHLRWWVVGMIALKAVAVLFAFPYYQSRYRGENYAATAREIHDRTGGHPLYTTNVSASGLSVVAHLDILRLPQPPLTFPPAQWETGFVIAYDLDPKLGEVSRRYRLGGNDLYLLCRGEACADGRRR
jgi:4-amino-4-deoxy-L-arabinose transferase-like glycosyltransferase